MAFSYQNQSLFWQEIDLTQVTKAISAQLESEFDYNGPFYLYHQQVLKDRISLLLNGLSASNFYYSVKSLSNIQILKQIRQFDRFGLDVVSGGEIMRGLLAGFKGSDMVFAGVGKTQKEIVLGIQKEIRSFHVESISELKAIASTAVSLGKVAPLALRVNPNIEVDTHKYITTGTEENKFGIPGREIGIALDIIKESNSLKLIGLQCHLGSQLLDATPYITSLKYMLGLAKEAEDKLGHKLTYLSLGGGFGVDYNDIAGDSEAAEFNLQELNNRLAEYRELPYEINFEPGRFISAYAGALITRVLYIKDKKEHQIAICDAGISELIRPALYGSDHPILPLTRKEVQPKIYDIVGPICESTDFIRLKAEAYPIEEGDLLAVLHAGAYGAVMSSNYNTRPLVPEILLHEKGFSVVRKPQSLNQLLSLES